MSLLTDTLGLPRQAPRLASRRYNLGTLSARLDELAAPARLLRLYFEQRAALREARRALERALEPKVNITLQCTAPDGSPAVEIIL